jgi:predicted amidohydrolase
MSSSSAAEVDNPDALRVALCQFPVTDNKEKNHQTASDYLQQAVDSGAKLVVFPEIWCSP